MINQLGVGEKLPPEDELARQFDVSRPTVRQALRELVSEGKLEKRRGLGSFVARPKLNTALTHIISLADQLTSEGLHYSTRLIFQEERTAHKDIAENLRVEPNTKIVYIERLRLLDNEPFYLSHDFLLFDTCRNVLQADIVNNSLFKCINQYCNAVAHSVRRYLEPAIANEYQARMLSIDVGAPIHYLQTYAYSPDGHLWGYFRDYFRGDRSRFAFTVTNTTAFGTSNPSILQGNVNFELTRNE